MNLKDAVQFAQETICENKLCPTAGAAPTQHIPQQYLDFSGRGGGNSNTPQTGEPRAPLPSWVADENAEVLPNLASINLAEIQEPQSGSAVSSTKSEAVSPYGVDALGYYLPFHFYKSGVWGIYLRLQGILDLSQHLLREAHGIEPMLSWNEVVSSANQLILDHEMLHAMVEFAATRAEVVTFRPVYYGYFKDRSATPYEEAMANAFAFRKLKSRNTTLKSAVKKWMEAQGAGYRDFAAFSRARGFAKGRALCEQNILKHASWDFDPEAAIPHPVLFSQFVGAAHIPIRLVVEGDLKKFTLKLFPKVGGLQVHVHTREHPPIHFHISIDVSRKHTRYRWPELSPLDGEPRLSGGELNSLHNYLRQFGDDIRQRLAKAYQAPDLPMPALP
jgi:hypothetical protein